MSTLQIPTIVFLYVAGYIGHVGRGYIIKVKEEAKPTDKEIILDVPLALKLAFQGWAWPLAAIQVSRSRGVCS
jgi:photosystem I subunit 3